MLAASISKKERIGISAPGIQHDNRSDGLPHLGMAGYGKRFLTNSAHMPHGFGAPGAQVGGSISGKASRSGAGRTGTGGSIGHQAHMGGMN